MRELPPRARGFVSAVVAIAALIIVWAGFSVSAPWVVLSLAVLYWLVSSQATATGTEVTISVGFIVGLAAVAIAGTAGGALVGVAAGFSVVRGRPMRAVKRFFNASQNALSLAAAGYAWQLLGAPVGRLDRNDFPGVLWAIAAASAVHFAINTALVASIVALTTNMSFKRVWTGNFSWMAAGTLGYGVMGLVLAQLYYELQPGILGGVFFLAPLLVARTAFANYAQLREAYDSTVRAFAQAVETKDYYTRGHSERVSRVAEMIAREHGMREDRVQVIRIAGMLHDVGKLGVPTRVLQKQGKLSQLEFEAIKLHPLRGYEMLCEIDFLSEALDGVYHHHERMDGRGYPMGLIGDEVPEFARIVMVADAFDSMTSTRSYRQAKTVDEAIAELRRCQGGQFDEHMVDCLVRAIGKHGWEPHPESFAGEQVTREGAPIPTEPEALESDHA